MDGHSIAWRNFGVPNAGEPVPLAPPTLPGLLVVAALGSLVLTLLACCLLSLQVAGERRVSAQLDRAIARRQREVTVYRKELAVLARFEELDRWNTVLGLQPPVARQYLRSEVELAALTPARVQVAYRAPVANRRVRIG